MAYPKGGRVAGAPRGDRGLVRTAVRCRSRPGLRGRPHLSAGKSRRRSSASPRSCSIQVAQRTQCSCQTTPIPYTNGAPGSPARRPAASLLEKNGFLRISAPSPSRRSPARRWSGSAIRTIQRRPWPRRRSSPTSCASPRSTTSLLGRGLQRAGSTSLLHRRSALPMGPGRRLQHTERALLDDRLSVGFRRGPALVRRALKKYRPTVARRRRSSCNAHRSSPGATRSTSRRPGSGTGANETPCSRARSKRLASRGIGRDDVPLVGGA